MKTVLKIEGMSCEHCVRHVRDALLGLEGVTDAEVSLDGGFAAVEHSEDVTAAEMAEAVKDAGYDVI